MRPTSRIIFGLNPAGAARALSSAPDRATAGATAAHVARAGWTHATTLASGLQVGRVGFGSPPFAAAAARNAALRAALDAGCNFIELSEPLQPGDPRLPSTENAYGDQLMCVSPLLILTSVRHIHSV
jgi:hypothetical protein